MLELRRAARASTVVSRRANADGTYRRGERAFQIGLGRRNWVSQRRPRLGGRERSREHLATLADPTLVSSWMQRRAAWQRISRGASVNSTQPTSRGAARLRKCPQCAVHCNGHLRKCEQRGRRSRRSRPDWSDLDQYAVMAWSLKRLAA